jgi:hypothetical protein
MIRTSIQKTEKDIRVRDTPPKLSYAQQIRALEARMSDEERSLYLDARNMGEDFCSAGL